MTGNLKVLNPSHRNPALIYFMNSKLQKLLSARRVPREYVPLDRVFIFLLITFFVKARHARSNRYIYKFCVLRQMN